MAPEAGALEPCDARGRRLPDGGCLRGLLWAVLAEGAAAAGATVLLYAWRNLHP